MEMNKPKNHRLATLVLAALVVLVLSGLSYAQTLIDQNKALAGGVTSGDAAGFPVTLSKSGSYQLSGNLTVPANADGIVIAADRVTLDLNGFSIKGSGSGSGVSDANVARQGIAVRNGSIANFLVGVSISGLSGCEIQQVHVINNSSFGILANGNNSIVNGNTVLRNGGIGIQVGENAIVSGNNVTGNQGNGISANAGAVISGNVASFNGQIGISAVCPESTLVGNTATQNGFGNIHETGIGCTRADNSPAP
jgi:hypothetical protein